MSVVSRKTHSRLAVCISLGAHVALVLFGWCLWPRILPSEGRADSMSTVFPHAHASIYETTEVAGGEEASTKPFDKINFHPGETEPHQGTEQVQAPVVRFPEVGPATEKSEFFGQEIKVSSVVYVVDRSLSMGASGALRQARAELRRSLHGLPSSAKFRVILYNQAPLALPVGSFDRLFPATEGHIRTVLERADRTLGSGDTNHMSAIRMGLRMRPELLFLVTDAEDLTSEQVEELTRFNRSQRDSTIRTIDLSGSDSATLRRLEEEN